MADEVREHFGDDRARQSVIPRSVRVSEAPSYGQSVMTYDPGSSGALAYLEAAREMAHRSSPRQARCSPPRPGAARAIAGRQAYPGC